tara:strand:+ start:950 stop:1333 length:384 start_codon:yes stop_codon:yes gene_type:complete
MNREVDWNETNLQCALGMMLDKGLLYDEGLVRTGEEKRYTKNLLIGYVLYLHVRGGLFDDKQKTLVELQKYFKSMTKSALRELINSRLRKYVRVYTEVKGARKKDGVEVSVRKKQHMRKVVKGDKLP